MSRDHGAQHHQDGAPDHAPIECAPRAREFDEAGRPDKAIFRRLGVLGLLGIRYEPRYGGQGLDYSYHAVFLEELALCDNAGVAMGITVQTDMATPALHRFGSEALKEKYLVPAIRGEQVAAIAVTEPGAGSDVAGIKTRAVRDGDHYVVKDVAFNPKPFQKPRIPVWVGGEGRLAQRRAGRYGDAWFPYFVRITPEELARRFGHAKQCARDSGRNFDALTLACCLPIELTTTDVPQEPDYLKGSTKQVSQALKKFRDVGVAHIGLQFMIPHWPERQHQIELFAKEVLPELKLG